MILFHLSHTLLKFITTILKSPENSIKIIAHLHEFHLPCNSTILKNTFSTFPFILFNPNIPSVYNSLGYKFYTFYIVIA